ncbi:GNAT family N-acetyltransferase [Pedobacter sp. LMG 31464]|uniref:GNAT family N-acetyltransferase n=1 Tax=Pedobacter planticolens TaxID=2679964 RepID=A0A923E1F4_9SPHI|nr:GNAT family N-acetyltransferase [Pedobacter planticolens]MBB2145717.1 GNAT family N-acetyltransferase [Pedobacter planticolens]
MEHILDNPIYNSLQAAHHIFASGTENVKYYSGDIAPFAGLKDNSIEDFESLYENSAEESTFVVFTPVAYDIPNRWKLVHQIDMFQMVYEPKELPTENDLDFMNLDISHVEEMLALVKLTEPGPFRSRTIELGNYTGVFNEDKLVAMAGHRFNPTPYVEISAVCTHPNHLGKGYAFGLIREQIKRILEKSETPFLHVRNDNDGAVKLYKKLGFHIRTEMIAYVFQKIAV